MSRKSFFHWIRPDRRRQAYSLALATAVLSSTTFSTLSAQQPQVPGQVKQVVGKELNSRRVTSSRGTGGGLLGGLFGSRSSSSSTSRSTSGSEPYRKATAVPEDRSVDWGGVPYHQAAPARVSSNNVAPLRDPGQATTPRRTATAPSSNVPKPPSLAQSTRSTAPRPSTVTPTTPRKVASAPTEISSRRPAPLSISKSSRRASSTPTTTSSPLVPKLTQSKTTAPASSPAVELVPKVARKVVQTQTAPKPEAKPVATKPEPTQTVEKKAETSSRRVASTPAPAQSVASTQAATKPPATQPAATKPAPTPTAPAPAPAKTQVADVPPVAKPTETVKPSMPAQPVMPTPVAKSQPTAPAPLALHATNTLGDARQTPSGTTAPTATGSTPAQTSENQVVKSSSRDSQPQTMKTFGTDNDSARSTGALAAADGVALRPISDRLPTETEGEKADAWHDSLNVSHDGFGTRSKPVAGPTKPSYQTAGYGSTNNFTSGYPTASGYPNAMRNDQYTGQPAMTVSPTATTPAVGTVGESTAASELPGIRVITTGPRNIMIRQTHAYEIRVENRGSVDAEGLVVRAHIPDWADVVGQKATRGEVSSANEGNVRQLDWRIAHVAAGQTERMLVRLKAARSGTHDLDVDWTLQPQKDVVQIHVQEPQLALTIDGPDTVIYGQSRTYQIRVLNPGDGVAPDVVFTLSPESSTPQSQRIGDIPSGKEAQFEVELTAQDLGDLKIHGLAVGDLELRAEADKTVKVLAADLEAILSGPEIKYQNDQAVYQLELTNHGTAASEDVVATLRLPVGVEYLGGMEGASIVGNEIRWKLASLTPGAVREYQFKCQMNATGTAEFAFDCKGSAAGQTDVALATEVEAIADLVLEVEDPAAPAPIDEDVTYTIVIRNRGSKPASDVRAVAQFSHGIEPQQISGHEGKVITGQVLIAPIARIDAGQEVRMRIVARAAEGGHHRFRTEVRSGDTVLVAEEATHYMNARNERITRRSGPGGNEFSLPLR